MAAFLCLLFGDEGGTIGGDILLNLRIRRYGTLLTFGGLGGGAMRIADNRHFRRSMATWQDTKKEMPACVGIQVSPAAPCKRAATTPYPLVNLLEATPRPCLQVTPAERQMSPTA